MTDLRSCFFSFDGEIDQGFALENLYALLGAGERALTVAQQADAALIARKGVFKRELAGFHFLHDGFQFGYRGFEGLGSGGRLWHG